MNKKALKVSFKMSKAIARLEKKYGKLEKDFFSEKPPYNDKFYCGCRLRSDIIKSLAKTVLFDGSIHNI